MLGVLPCYLADLMTGEFSQTSRVPFFRLEGIMTAQHFFFKKNLEPSWVSRGIYKFLRRWTHPKILSVITSAKTNAISHKFTFMGTGAWDWDWFFEKSFLNLMYKKRAEIWETFYSSQNSSIVEIEKLLCSEWEVYCIREHLSLSLMTFSQL